MGVRSYLISLGAHTLTPTSLTASQRKVGLDILRRIDAIAAQQDARRAKSVAAGGDRQSASYGVSRPAQVFPVETAAEYLRLHQSIVLNGQRGTGKTSLLITLHQIIKTHLASYLPEQREQAQAALCGSLSNEEATTQATARNFPRWADAVALPPIFPALRESDTGLMEEIFGAILRELHEETDRFDRNSDEIKEVRRLEGELRKVWEGWTYDRELGAKVLGRDAADFPDYVDQRMKVASRACNRQRLWDGFIDSYLDWRRSHTMVICIDDSDLKPSVAIEVAEVIHRFLAHPRIVTIVAADLEEFRTHIQDFELLEHGGGLRTLAKLANAFWRDGDSRADDLAKSIGEKKENIDRQVQEFLRKVMPVPLRLDLPPALTDGDIHAVSGIDLAKADIVFSRRTEADPNIGSLGLWLLLYRHSALLRRMKLRHLNQFMLWLQFHDQDVATAQWHPEEAILSFFDRHDERRDFQARLRSVRGESTQDLAFNAQTSCWEAEDERGHPVLVRDWAAGALGSLADLNCLRTGHSLRHFPVDIRAGSRDLLPAKTTTFRDAIADAVSPLSAELPANAWYYADLRAISTRLLPSQAIKKDALTLVLGTKDRLPALMGGWVSVLCDEAKKERDDAILNAWLYFNEPDSWPHPPSTHMTADFRAQFANYARLGGGSPIAAGFLRFIKALRDSPASSVGEARAALRNQLGMALLIAQIPLSGIGAENTQTFIRHARLSALLELLAEIMDTNGCSPERISWRDRFMLALAFYHPLTSIRLVRMEDESEVALGRAIKNIIAFLAAPLAAEEPSAFDLIHVLGGWDQVMARRAVLYRAFRFQSRHRTPFKDEESRWLGMDAEMVRKLRDENYPK